MGKNYKFGKLIEGAIEYAPKPILTEGGIYFGNNENVYLAKGWKKIINTQKPEETEGFYYTSAWAENETNIEKVWNLNEEETPESVPEENEEEDITEPDIEERLTTLEETVDGLVAEVAQNSELTEMLDIVSGEAE